MDAIAIACPEVPGNVTSEQAIALASLELAGKSSKSGGRIKGKKGPPPDVLRKGGAHQDKKRKTGREKIRPEEIPEKTDD